MRPELSRYYVSAEGRMCLLIYCGGFVPVVMQVVAIDSETFEFVMELVN